MLFGVLTMGGANPLPEVPLPDMTLTRNQEPTNVHVEPHHHVVSEKNRFNSINCYLIFIKFIPSFKDWTDRSITLSSGPPQGVATDCIHTHHLFAGWSSWSPIGGVLPGTQQWNKTCLRFCRHKPP